MAYKMKGHELPGPNQRKGSPTKYIQLILGGLSAIAGAAKKNREKTKALRKQAKDSMKQGAEGGGGIPDATKIPDANKMETFKADMDKK